MYKIIIFVIVIFVWAFIGWLGGLHANENRINYEMIIFLGFAPFIPLLVKVCGLV